MSACLNQNVIDAFMLNYVSIPHIFIRHEEYGLEERKIFLMTLITDHLGFSVTKIVVEKLMKEERDRIA